MKKADVIIIGAGRAGQTVAERLAASNKTTVLIALPNRPEDYFRDLVTTLASPRPPAAQEPRASNALKITAARVPRFLDARTLDVDGETWTAAHFVIASGSAPLIPNGFEDGKFLTPAEALAHADPRSASVLGAGPLGTALAATLAQRGGLIELVDRGDRLLRKFDRDLSEAVSVWLQSLGVRLRLQTAEKPQDPVVLAAGTVGNTAGFDFAKAGVFVTPERGVAVDEEARTSVPHIFAAGAVTEPLFNLEFEILQAETAAENVVSSFFSRKKIEPGPIPMLLPFAPPFASVGEAETGNEPLNGRMAVVVPFGPWRVKLIGKKKSAELTGAHAFGPGADALILYFNLLMRAGISLQEVAERHHYPGSIAGMAADAVEAWLKR